MSQEDRRLLEAAMIAEELAEATGVSRVGAALGALVADYAGHGIELVARGGRWHFQTAPDRGHILRRTRAEPRRLSRAATETLAIISYHEPVSRAEMEAIRGVAVAKDTLDLLVEAGRVTPAGRRETPGRPLIYATTTAFLQHFGLVSRADLPGVKELRAAGLLHPVDLALEQYEVAQSDDAP